MHCRKYRALNRAAVAERSWSWMDWRRRPQQRRFIAARRGAVRVERRRERSLRTLANLRAEEVASTVHCADGVQSSV